jgi:hypothetical protein
MPSDYELSYYVWSTGLQRSEIIKKAQNEGYWRASSEYPYAVHRERSKIEQAANEAFEQWYAKLSKNQYALSDWKSGSNSTEGKRLFVAGWVAGYEKLLGEKEQTQPQPATSTTGAAVQGVTITLLEVERNGNEYIYTVKINDPTLQHPIIRELAFDKSRLQTWIGKYGEAHGDARRS